VQFLFADHWLDTDRRELRRGSELVAVEPQVFDLLVFLVQNRDRVVSKDDLIASVWGGRIVSESTLTSRINAARKAVGDSGKEQRLIRTIARKGFRFIGTVDEKSPTSAPTTSATSQPPPPSLMPPRPLPVKPSIAVLPFVNMSNEAEQDSFVDGLTEDLITDLSRHSGMFVIARNSTFAYKGKSMDVRLISQDLGVRYLLEGSARRANGRVRINVQLIDAVGGEHLWAERFDRTLEDVFELQDEVTGKIVEALVGRLTAPTRRRRPQNLAAYDLFVRARVLTEESPQTAREAYLLLNRAIELEPSYAEAHGLLGYNRWLAWTHFGEPEDPNRNTAIALANKAVALDPNDAFCRYVLGTILAYERRWEESDAEFAVALELDPNHADTWAALSDMSTLSGRVADGLEQIRKAFRFNPYPPSWYFLHLGQAQYAARDYASAVETLRREETYRTNSRRFLAASLAQLGRLDEARREVEMFLVTHPYFTIGHWIASQPLRDAAITDHFVEGFRKAGLPE
jgi:adenylate cyclase